MNRQEDKKKNMLLTVLERLAAWVMDVLEHVTHSSSWKRWFRTLLMMGATMMKGGHHG